MWFELEDDQLSRWTDSCELEHRFLQTAACRICGDIPSFDLAHYLEMQYLQTEYCCVTYANRVVCARCRGCESWLHLVCLINTVDLTHEMVCDIDDGTFRCYSFASCR